MTKIAPESCKKATELSSQVHISRATLAVSFIRQESNESTYHSNWKTILIVSNVCVN